MLAFHPDLVIYSATTLDVRLMEIHLCDMLRKNVDLKYEFLQEATSLQQLMTTTYESTRRTDAEQGPA